MGAYVDRQVMAYAFECYDLNLDMTIAPPFKATQQAIRPFHGKLIPMTGEMVDIAELDNDGRWFRLATGWGTVA